MSKRHSLWIPVLLSLATSFATADALAGGKSGGGKNEAKQALSDAKAAMKDKRYADAARAYKKADDLDPQPQTKLDLARAYIPAGKLTEASKALHGITDAPATTPGAKKVADAAKKMLTELEPRIPWITVKVGTATGKETHTTIDDTEVDATSEVPMNPGDHRVIAEADGYEPEEKTVHLEEGEHKKVKMVLNKTPGDKPKSEVADTSSGGGGFSKAPGLIALSIGAAGLGVGIAFGLMAQSQTNDVKSQCNDNGICPPAVEDELVTAKNNGNVSTISFIVGGVGVATGVVLLIASIGGKKAPEPSKENEKEKEKEALHVSPWFTGTSAGLHGTF